MELISRKLAGFFMSNVFKRNTVIYMQQPVVKFFEDFVYNLCDPKYQRLNLV